jgi:hypothetical protein
MSIGKMECQAVEIWIELISDSLALANLTQVMACVHMAGQLIFVEEPLLAKLTPGVRSYRWQIMTSEIASTVSVSAMPV